MSIVDSGFITEMKDKNGDSWYHQIVVETQQDEIERLNNIIKDLQADYGNKAQVERDLLKEENERLKLIIKEVREYIENELWNYFGERNIYLKVRDSFLEILDKGE